MNEQDENAKALPIEDIYPHEFWLEKYNNENKRKRITFDKFQPKPKVVPITLKFYSKYDCRNDHLTDGDKFKGYRKFIEKSFRSFPKDSDCYVSNDILEKQIFKLITNRVLQYDACDLKRFYRPIQKTELNDFAEKLEIQKITCRPRFTGPIFKF